MNNEETTLHPEFVHEMLNTLVYRKNKDLLQTVLAHLKPSYIGDENLRKVYTEVRNQVVIDGKVPTIGTLKMNFRKDQNVLDTLDEIKEADVIENELMLTELEKFVKHCKFIEVYNKSAELFNTGKKSEAFKLFETGGTEIVNYSIRKGHTETIFKDFTKRNAERMSGKGRGERIPYVIDELQAVTGGGETGRFTLFLADAKKGKSFLLTQLGVGTARLGYPTLHVQLEGTRKEAVDRYDQCFTGSTMEELYEGITDKKYKAAVKLAQNVGKNDIYIYAPEKFGAVNMLDVRQYIIDLKKQGIDIKVVIMDYLELADPDAKGYKPSEERYRQQATAKACKDIAMEQDVWFISATQTSSISSLALNDPDFVIRREDLAEDKGKVRPVDQLITLNRTSDEKKNKVMRLFVDAIRNAEGEDIIFIGTAFHRGRFYDRKRTLAEMYDPDAKRNNS